MRHRRTARDKTAAVEAMPAVESLSGWRRVIAEAGRRYAEEERELRQNRSRQRDEEILAAALRVFARHGVAKARISDIAAEAGIPAPSLYGYYENKEELAYAIPIKRQVQFFAEYAEQSDKLDTVHDQLRHFLWLTTDYARRNPDWARVLYLEVWPSVLIKESPVRDVIDDYARIVLGLIEEGASRGEWPEDPNPYQTATILVGAVSQLIITWLIYRRPRDVTRAAMPLIERMLTLLTHPLRDGERVNGADVSTKASPSGKRK